MKVGGVQGKQEMTTFGGNDNVMTTLGGNSRNDFQTPTRRERDEENVEETNNEQGDEGSPLSSGDGDRGNALRFHVYIFGVVLKLSGSCLCRNIF